MGTLMGHVLPGTYFGVCAIWWGFCLSVKFFYSRHATEKTGKTVPYRSSTIFAGICFPIRTLRHFPLETWVQVTCAMIGLLITLYFGTFYRYDEKSHRRTLEFYDITYQHMAMYSAFGLQFLFDVLVHYKYELPLGIEYVARILAFTVEGFIFYFHLHGRDELDILVHTLLVFAIGACALASMWEYCRPEEILAAYARTAATLLQGTWFYVLGFILYFPSDDPYWTWQPTHSHMLIIDSIFIWLSLLIVGFLLVQSALIWLFLKRCCRNQKDYRVLRSNYDNDECIHSSDHHALRISNTSSDKNKAIVNTGDQNEDNDESQLEFDSSRNLLPT